MTDIERENNVVYKEVFDQLVSQGTSREDSNAQAIMYSAVFEVLGREGNVNPGELFQKYGLDIQRIFDGQNIKPKKELIDVVDEVKKAREPVVENVKKVPVERTEQETKEGDSVNRKFYFAKGFDDSYLPSYTERTKKKDANITPEREED